MFELFSFCSACSDIGDWLRNETAESYYWQGLSLNSSSACNERLWGAFSLIYNTITDLYFYV
jgi:hypothetical protein